jgi:hypothetical protein
MRFRELLLTLALVVGFIATREFIAWAANPSFPETWNSAYEANPAAGDQVSVADDHFRTKKQEIRRRMAVEHDFSTVPTGGTDDGRHIEGSARIYWQNGDPNAITGPGGAPANDVDPSAPSSALDQGRMWRDADGGNLKCYNGSAWVECIHTLDGDPNNEISLTNGMQWLRAGANRMDMHAHASRHADLTAGTDGQDFDFIANLVQDPQYTSGAGGTTVTTTTDVALLSDSMTTTSRRGTSHAIVIASTEMQRTSGTDRGAVYLSTDNCTTEELHTKKSAYMTSAQRFPVTLFFYDSGLAADATHTYTLCGETQDDLTLDWQDVNSQIVILDLGVGP